MIKTLTIFLTSFFASCSWIRLPPSDPNFSDRIVNCIELVGKERSAICDEHWGDCESVARWCGRYENYSNFSTSDELSEMKKELDNIERELKQIQKDLQ